MDNNLWNAYCTMHWFATGVRLVRESDHWFTTRSYYWYMNLEDLRYSRLFE